MRRLTLAIAGVLIGASGFASLFQSAPALAYPGCPNGQYADFGRNTFYGYFNNRCYNGVGDSVVDAVGGAANSVPNSVNDATSFINWVNALRTSGNAQEKTAAQFYILTMLPANGHPYPDYNRGDANSRFNEWAQDVRSAGAEGRLDFHFPFHFPCGTKNSEYQQPLPKTGAGFNDVAFYFQEAGDPKDPCGPNVYVDSIVVKDRSGNIAYAIKRFCGNPIGQINAIPNGDFTVTPSGYSNTTQMIPGDTNTIHVQLDNSGPSISDTGRVQVHPVLGGTTVGSGPGSVTAASAIPAVIAAGGANQTVMKDGGTTISTGDGYENASTIAGLNGPDWWWNTKRLPSGSSSRASVDITVPATSTYVGLVTFNICFNPRKPQPTGGTVCAHVTIQLVSARTVGVYGFNGDVQAGGGLGNCPTASTGDIHAFNGAGSYGQYVVSTSGLISNFGSKNNATSTALSVGKNGGYAQVCRQDILAVAQSYKNAGVGGCTLVGGVQVGQLCTLGTNDLNLDGLDGVYFYLPGSTLKIHGTITHKVTIVALAGNIEISGPVTVAGGSADPRAVPSLGLLSATNIAIDPSVTSVDAYMFANKVIDTCVGGAAPACDNTLTVNGFMMANTISFNRLGPFNTNGQQAGEKVYLTPQIYLNPPKFFDSTVDQNAGLTGEGERQPLF